MITKTCRVKCHAQKRERYIENGRERESGDRRMRRKKRRNAYSEAVPPTGRLRAVAQIQSALGIAGVSAARTTPSSQLKGGRPGGVAPEVPVGAAPAVGAPVQAEGGACAVKVQFRYTIGQSLMALPGNGDQIFCNLLRK
jgi:hypothetical protein